MLSSCYSHEEGKVEGGANSLNSAESNASYGYSCTANVNIEKLEIESFEHKYVFNGSVIHKDNGVSSEATKELLQSQLESKNIFPGCTELVLQFADITPHSVTWYNHYYIDAITKDFIYPSVQQSKTIDNIDTTVILPIGINLAMPLDSDLERREVFRLVRIVCEYDDQMIEYYIFSRYDRMSNEIKRFMTKGLTSFQLKITALVCMTIDHLAAHGFEIHVFARHTNLFRSIGRIAAPLFLFVLVQSVRHTRNKPKLILRLYIAGMSAGLFQAATNFFLGNTLGFFTPGNIIFTFFFIALYIYLIEQVIEAVKVRSLRQGGVLIVIFIVVSFLPNILYNLITPVLLPQSSDMRYILLIPDLRDSFFPSNYHAEYGLVFITLGVVLYFAKTKKLQCIVFGCFCALCVIGTFILIQGRDIFDAVLHLPAGAALYFDIRQCFMLLALPLMIFYNGQRGSGGKWFFYIYYPTHRYLINLMSAIVRIHS